MAAHTYTLKDVVDLERPAWHETTEGVVDFVYDGIHFWCGPRADSGCDIATANMLPLEGWRHKQRCRCSSCQAARRQAA